GQQLPLLVVNDLLTKRLAPTLHHSAMHLTAHQVG
ncbi:MAG: hypothetical protein RLZZ395_1134, partial [Pseudomonadota bacterium]